MSIFFVPLAKLSCSWLERTGKPLP